MEKLLYTKKQLYISSKQKSYRGDAKEAAFLLGGIGTGNVSIGARGEFRDWEIFNNPGKGIYLAYSFFAIWVKPEGSNPIIKVLESKIKPPYSQALGFNPQRVAGLPRLESSTMRGEYPFVWIDFEDRELPLEISLEAFNPFIPHNADESGIPGAIIRYKVKNTSNKIVRVTIVGSLSNAIGFEGYDRLNNMKVISGGVNEYRDNKDLRGLFFYSSKIPKRNLKYGSMALMTRANNVTAKKCWLEGNWIDGMTDFWADFCEDGILEMESKLNSVGSRISHKTQVKVGSLGILDTLYPSEEKVFEFILTWYFPNRVKGWDDENYHGTDKYKIEKNYYSTLFDNAYDVGKYIKNNMLRLEKISRDFHYALFNTTMPSYVIEAIANNITVIRSPTCFRIKDGTFLSWEGCRETKGMCFGNCTHVWNYAQTLAFLFPELEHTMRIIEFNLETDDEGKMAFRSQQVFGRDKWEMLPAVDGQMGTIIRLYRDWKLSGDDELLKKVWDKASKALNFAFDYWDTDGDCVLDGQQHTTYDIEFYGPNPLTNTLFFTALKAGIEMANYLGDEDNANKYTDALEKGSQKMDEILWEKEYYVQKIEDINKYQYQYGQGCLSDQLFGQLLAHVICLGYILPEKHVKEAIRSIFKYNFQLNLEKVQNVQRTYALNDEKGLILCTWPKGGKPKFPFIYCDEIWTGIEYQVASHLIYEGFIEEGLTLVKAVRDRYDGYRRNPWNEAECGYHYVRTLASWSVLLALSGFKYDMVKGNISFSPKINQNNFSTFWSTGKAWGMYSEKRDPKTGERKWNIEVYYGDLEKVKIN